ncbi:Trehalose-6-phosphate phosphatase [hydrothermal vent metagenome]|uniref:trehalose-phosphatase n=1 Tax=hydrothermal vent metagenome TaxID=652676 RepID=A0A3B0QN29_9ZZZZ
MSAPLNNIEDFEGFGREVVGRRLSGRRLPGRRLSLFLDFDGTLAPIAETPALAELPPGSREVLKRLSSIYPVAVISGRGLADIREKVGLTNITYGANHGMTIRSAPPETASKGFEMDYDIGADKLEELKAAAKVLREVEARYEGVLVEDKGATLSLHYRRLEAGQIEALMKELDSELGTFKERGLLRVTGGKKVIELRPAVDWNKGRAVEWILGQEPFASTCPVYIGDDETDRDGFRAVRGIGVSVYVGAEDKDVSYHMEQSSVVGFLRWLIEFGAR